METLNISCFMLIAGIRSLEDEEPTNWYLAPVPSAFEIPPTQELQMDLEKNNKKGNKVLINFPEEESDESISSKFRKSLFKPTNYTYGNAGNKENTNAKRGVDTYWSNTPNEEMNIDLWKNNMQIAQYSDFNLPSVNDIISASANGKGIENAYSFPCVSKTSSVEGKLHLFL
ncbi:hypothetical protein JD844_017619 [Phrynosoma platyrhinos]|uniref:Uncharacterized protein n=1 Tax=Phrynosoma platyrhinos TaxID=52577 RepID=A0ABQ7SM87_PHRPL|nr:hypothetical protein JD844_017619 [Phrynosoma platyrhinos]